MEYLNQPKKFYKYKIQPDKSALNNKKKLQKVSDVDISDLVVKLNSSHFF